MIPYSIALSSWIDRKPFISVAYMAHTTILSIAHISLRFTEAAVLGVLLIIRVIHFQHCALSTSFCNPSPSQKKCLGNS
jgi:hypothetical protein